jgi:sulfhydrogenase subunit alpha
MSKNIEVPALARVEGEGALLIRISNGSVQDIEVNIYEPPRFFEGFLRGRSLQEVPDITARICGICPVAYQMSSVQALEQALRLTVSPDVRALRKLLYCSEYIESHALHVYMLQAPDLLGHESVLSLAEVAPEVVKRALRLKKVGNELLGIIGGRSVHPVNACVGGFYSWPDVNRLRDMLPDLRWGLQASLETVHWAAGLPYPDLEVDYEFVALTHPQEYAILEGNIISNTGREISPAEFEVEFIEEQVRHSNALHSRTREGTPYLTGPLARLNLNHDRLSQPAREVCEEIGLHLPLRNPYKSLLARSIELVQVFTDAITLIESFDPEGASRSHFKPQSGEGFGVSEAPRGILYHRYIIDEGGLVRHAKITPPTSQNLARMEADLWILAPQVLQLPHAQATLACEHLIRSYDPCISCATHFLTLKVEEV